MLGHRKRPLSARSLSHKRGFVKPPYEVRDEIVKALGKPARNMLTMWSASIGSRPQAVVGVDPNVIACLAMGIRHTLQGTEHTGRRWLTVYHWDAGYMRMHDMLRDLDNVSPPMPRAKRALVHMLDSRPCGEDGRDTWQRDVEVRVAAGAAGFGLVTLVGIGTADDMLGNLDVLAPLMGDTTILMCGLHKKGPQQAYTILNEEGWAGTINGLYAFLQRPPLPKER